MDSLFSRWVVKRSIIFASLLMVLIGTTCGPQIEGRQREKRMAATTIAEILKQNTDRLMSIPGVVGTAIGEQDGHPCILVLVVKKTTDLMSKIPSTLEGFPVVVEETGTIRPMKTSRVETAVRR